MKKKNRLKYLVISAVICGCLALFLLPIFSEVIHVDSPQMDPSDNPPWSHMQYFQIDPATVLGDLQIGQEAFRLVEEQPDIPEHPSGSFTWSSEDYFTIAKALHLYLTGEPAEGEWKLYSPGDFQIDQCRDELQGFDRAYIIFYKREPGSFPVTYMEIEPLKEKIDATAAEYQRVEHQSPLDRFFDDPDSHFEEAKAVQGEISAEDAWRIAEDAVGKEMRKKLSNKGCEISVTYFVDKWVVWYYWRTEELNFTLDVEINSQDGSYKIERKLNKCERTICP